MKWHRDGAPTAPGWYVVRERGRMTPRLLWWSDQSRDWREGTRLVHATAFLGPLPEPPR